MTVVQRAGVAVAAIVAIVTLTAGACERAAAGGARKVGAEVGREVLGPAGDVARDTIEDHYRDQYRTRSPYRSGG